MCNSNSNSKCNSKCKGNRWILGSEGAVGALRARKMEMETEMETV